MDCEIAVKAGKSKGRKFKLTRGGRLTIGRGLKADIQVFDEGVSRVHCAIESKDDCLTITDLESSNGTYVGGQPVSTAKIYNGDEIRLGLAVLEVRGPPRPEKVKTRTTTVTFLQPSQPSQPSDHPTDFMKKIDPDATGMLRAYKGVEEVESLRRAHRNLATIYRVTNTINSHRDPGELAQALAGILTEVTGAERVAVLLRARRGGEIKPVASCQRGKDGPIENLALARSAVEDVLGKAICVIRSDVKHGAGKRSVMCVPLLAPEEIVGALYVDSPAEEARFGESQLELLAAIGNQAGVALQRARLLSELEELFFSSIRSLVAAVDAKDSYTHGHSERVTAFALKLAKELGLDEQMRELIRLAGILHDVGKIAVPEYVLNKPGELTDEEFEQIKRHPVHGAGIVQNIQSPYVPDIAPGVRYHHEHWDGSGYPEGLVGEKSPLVARILALADAFDAMTSDRPYRNGFSMDKAAGIVKECRGTQFDPELAEAFLRLHKRGELTLPETMALKYTTMATPKIKR